MTDLDAEPDSDSLKYPVRAVVREVMEEPVMLLAMAQLVGAMLASADERVREIMKKHMRHGANNANNPGSVVVVPKSAGKLPS